MFHRRYHHQSAEPVNSRKRADASFDLQAISFLNGAFDELGFDCLTEVHKHGHSEVVLYFELFWSLRFGGISHSSVSLM